MAGGRPFGRLVGQSVGWFSNILKNSKSRFGDYITVVYALNNTFLIIVLYRHDQLVGWSVCWSVGQLVGLLVVLQNIEVW